MAKFLSSERKVILSSALTGTGLITISSSLLLLNTDSIILWILFISSLLITYFIIPVWFNRNRPLEKRAVKSFTPEGIEIKESPNPEYKYFNADNEEVKTLSDKEITVGVILFLVINVLLFGLIYKEVRYVIINCYPSYKNIISLFFQILIFATPYLVYHSYFFVRNRSMNISASFNTMNPQHFHQHDNNSSRNTATNPGYSYLNYNIYHHRK